GRGVTDTAVGNDGVGAAYFSAHGQDVAECSGAFFAACFHDDDVIVLHRVHGLFLLVETATVFLEQVFAVWHIAQGLGEAENLTTRVHRGWPVDGAVVDTAFAHICNDGGNGGLGDFFTQFIGQDGTWIFDTGCCFGAPSFFTLYVVNFWTVAIVGQRKVCFGNVGYEATGGWGALGTWCINFYFDDVAWLGNRGTSGGTGQNDVACFKGHHLREVCDQLAKWEDQVVGGVILGDFAVDPGANPELGWIDTFGVDDCWAQWRVIVTGFVFDVGTFVCVAQIVQAPVVCCGDTGNIGPAVFGSDTAGVFTNDQGDFAFVGEQLCAGRTFNGRTGGCDRRSGLQKVAGE